MEKKIKKNTNKCDLVFSNQYSTDSKHFYKCYDFLKGYNCEVDSYSAFFNNGGFENTEMEEELDKHQIGKVYVVGIALDYCVFYSAMDSQKLGKYFFRYGCKNLPDFIS